MNDDVLLPGQGSVLHRSLSKLLPSQLEPPLQLRVRVRVPPLQVRLQDDQEDHGVHVAVEDSTGNVREGKWRKRIVEKGMVCQGGAHEHASSFYHFYLGGGGVSIKWRMETYFSCNLIT